MLSEFILGFEYQIYIIVSWYFGRVWGIIKNLIILFVIVIKILTNTVNIKLLL